MTSLTNELTPKTLLNCGILEEYHDTDFEDFYGHPSKWKELLPLIEQWNAYYPNNPIRLDYNEGHEIIKKIAKYVKNITTAKQKGISILLAGSNGTGK